MFRSPRNSQISPMDNELQRLGDLHQENWGRSILTIESGIRIVISQNLSKENKCSI